MPGKPKKLSWSRRAKRDVADISLYYLERNGNDHYSLALLDKFEKAAETIQQNEEIGEQMQSSDYRFLTVESFMLIYRIDQRKIVIASV